jgi:hypothetical protein
MDGSSSNERNALPFRRSCVRCYYVGKIYRDMRYAMIKKLLLVGMIFLLCGCCSAAIKESELFEHDSVYKDFGHLWFSWHGYKNIDENDVLQTKNEQWWGITKIYKPAEKSR